LNWKLNRAAEEHARFLAAHPGEAQALQEWEAAPLGQDIHSPQS